MHSYKVERNWSLITRQSCGVLMLLLTWSGMSIAQAKSAPLQLDPIRQYESLLAKSVKGNLVDYNIVQEESKTLLAYLRYVSVTEPKNWTKTEQLAFYINAYNAIVLNAVLTHKRPARVLDVPGFFDQLEYTVGGRSMTLNTLEEKKIRSSGDPRVHFVVNCASYDCPPLAPFLYRADQLEAQLENQTAQFLRQTQSIRVSKKENNIEISELFKWYEKDWGTQKDVRLFLARYRPDLSRKLKQESLHVSYRKYNWALNSYQTHK